MASLDAGSDAVMPGPLLIQRPAPSWAAGAGGGGGAAAAAAFLPFLLRTLRVGTTGDFNPMSFKDTSTNSLVGYDIEAMTQLATDMGVKVEFVTT